MKKNVKKGHIFTCFVHYYYVVNDVKTMSVCYAVMLPHIPYLCFRQASAWIPFTLDPVCDVIMQ